MCTEASVFDLVSVYLDVVDSERQQVPQQEGPWTVVYTGMKMIIKVDLVTCNCAVGLLRREPEHACCAAVNWNHLWRGHSFWLWGDSNNDKTFQSWKCDIFGFRRTHLVSRALKVQCNRSSTATPTWLRIQVFFTFLWAMPVSGHMVT